MSDGGRKITGQFGLGNPGKPRGAVNKAGAEVKTMLIEALSEIGGKDYLIAKAKSHPAPFLALIGKLIPSEVKAEVTGKDGAPFFAPDQLRRIADEIESKE